jgi:amidophosphoribosyltransferase
LTEILRIKHLKHYSKNSKHPTNPKVQSRHMHPQNPEIFLDTDGDSLHEECGVFGIYGHEDAAALCALGLHALQHRGQEACGIVTHDGKHFFSKKALGLVDDTFSSAGVIDSLKGSLAIGHNRYSTAGEPNIRNVQPMYGDLDFGGFAIGHNGNLTNAYAIRAQMVQQGAIDPNAVRAFDRFLDTNVVNKFQGQQAITGQTLKQIQSDLRERINLLSASTDADQRLMGQALQEVQDQFRQLVIRSNPQNAKELKAIDTGYANFKRVQRASGITGAEEGIFSPAQLQSAVRAMDKSKDKSRFATGEALMQDLSETGKTVLGNKLPDSGTPYRSLAALIASGGAAGAGYPAIAAGMLAGPALYSAPGQRLAAAALTARPAGAAAVANQLRANQGIKTGTLAANQLANQQQSAFDEFLRANAALDPRFKQALEAGR